MTRNILSRFHVSLPKLTGFFFLCFVIVFVLIQIFYISGWPETRHVAGNE